MNARIIALIVVVLALVGGGIFFISGQSSPAVAKPSPTVLVTASPTTAPTATPTQAPTVAPTQSPAPTASSAFEVAGLVLSGTGAPIADASVRLYRASSGCAQFNTKPEFAAQTVSGSDGSFDVKVPKVNADQGGLYILYAQTQGRFIFFDRASSCDTATKISASTPNIGTIKLVIP